MSTNITTSQWGIAAIILLAGLTLGYFIGKRSSNEANPNAFDNLKSRDHSWSPVPTATANDEMDAFRQRLAFLNLSVHPRAKTMCIVHDAKSAVEYNTTFFPNWVATHTPKAGYKWVIGLYPEICKEKVADGSSDKPRISIFMIPTMQSANTSTPKDILDYFTIKDTEDKKYYLPDNERPKDGANLPKNAMLSDDFIYDQGTIFP